MHQLLVRALADVRSAHIAHSTRNDGDLGPRSARPDLIEKRRSAAVPGRRWRVVHQVHGRTVVDADSDPRPFPDADAIVSTDTETAIAVHSGDCVPVGFVHPAGALAVAHAGWKGLDAGVVAATVDHLRSRFGAAPIEAAIGPHIRAERYEFGEADLARLVARLGPEVASSTADGRPALDLAAAIRSALAAVDVVVAASSPDCTAELDARYWSHRARGESARIALVAWFEQP